MSIRFHFYGTRISLSERKRLKQFISRVFKQYKIVLGTLDVIFCTDNFLLDINRNHLKHDYYTDVITFTLSEPGKPVVGEIYISVDRVRDNAKDFKIPVRDELLRIILHGTLHLCGFNDKSSKEKKSMTLAENKLIELFKKGVPRNTVSS
jgi:probable rRNA maturation factor